jgi:hypothetical protein
MRVAKGEVNRTRAGKTVKPVKLAHFHARARAQRLFHNYHDAANV